MKKLYWTLFLVIASFVVGDNYEYTYVDEYILQNTLDNSDDSLAPIIEDATPLSSCSINVIWNCISNCSDVIQYIVYWNEVEGNATDGNSGSLSNEIFNYVITDLLTDTLYEITVSARFKNGDHASNITLQSTEAPPNITNIFVDDKTDTRVSLRWTTSNEDCTMKYIITYFGDILCDPGKTAGSAISDEETYLLYGLKPFTNYSIGILATSDGKRGQENVIDDVVTDQGKPGPPESVTANVLNSSSIDLSWVPPLECNGILLDYIVSWTLQPDNIQIDSVSVSGTKYQVVDLLECGEYEFSVQATTKAEEGYPAVATSTTDPIPTPPVTNLTDRDTTSTSTNLTWIPPDTNCPVISYVMEVEGIVLWADEEYNIDSNFEIVSNENEDFYYLEDLIPFSNYTVCIVAKTDGNSSNSTCTEFPTPEDVPSEPRNLESTVLSSTEVKVSWEPPEKLNGILLSYTISWTSENWNQTFSNVTEEEEFVITGLLPCVSYNISVTGETSVGPGPPSVTSATLDPEVPPPPLITTCYTIDSTSIELAWDAPNTTCDIFRYEVETSGTVEWSDEKPSRNYITKDSEITLDKLIPDTKYVITVKAKTNKNLTYSEPSESCSTTTPEDVPESPSNLTINSPTTSDFWISWKEPEIKNGALKRFQITLSDERDPDYVNYDQTKETYSYQCINLVSATSYIVYVSAETSKGFGEPANATASTLVIEDEDSNLGLALGITIGLLVVIVAVVLGFYYRDDIQKRMTTLRTHPVGEQEVASDFNTTPMPLAQIRNYVNKLDNDRTLDAEFNSLSANSYKGSTSVGSKSENSRMNRYANIIPFDASRVILNRGLSSYINANYINSFLVPQFFIATQGPKENTTEDFWNLIWQEHIDTIVMLTSCFESGQEKCHQYWPKPLGYGIDLGVFTIQNLNEEATPLFAVRMFEINHRDEGKKRLVKQYQYVTWPDFGAPAKHDDLLKFLCTVKQNLSSIRTENRMIVHCSGGVGRTGTFICLWNIIEAIDYGVQSLSVAKEVLELRRQRVLMVQSKEQYRCLCKCVLEYYENQAKWKIKPKDDSPQSSSRTSSQTDGATTSTSAFLNLSFEPNDEFEGNLI